MQRIGAMNCPTSGMIVHSPVSGLWSLMHYMIVEIQPALHHNDGNLPFTATTSLPAYTLAIAPSS
jgi:hypothetical protein